jgi:hypothetical protein
LTLIVIWVCWVRIYQFLSLLGHGTRSDRTPKFKKKNQHFISGTFSLPIESSWRDEQLSCLLSSFKSKSRPNRSSSALLIYSKPKKPCQYCAVEYVGLKNHENICHKKPNKTVKTNSSSHNLSYFALFVLPSLKP